MKEPNTKLQTPKKPQTPSSNTAVEGQESEEFAQACLSPSFSWLPSVQSSKLKVQSSWPASVSHANAVKERSAPYGVGVVVCRRARFTGDICGQRREGW